MASHRRHQILTRLKPVRCELGDDEFRFAFLVVELPAVARVVRQIENIFVYSRVEILESGHHVLDVIADSVVIRGQVFPIHGRSRCQRSFCETSNNRRLASEMFARRICMSAGRIDDPH